MAIQTLTLNVNAQPSAEDRAFLYLSQNENGRDIRFRILGDDLPSGCTATLSGVKPDGNVWSKAGTVTNNFVVVEEDIQMTAVAGRWDAQLDIVNGSKNIVTALIRITVEAAAVEAGAVPSDTQLEGYVEQCKQYAETAKNEAYGSPLTAATAAAMTDQSRVYVYTGSETGYTAGHWYYHNGTSWTDGGVYNAVAVDTDTTLSVSGKAADAKKTGDEISQIKEDLNTTVMNYHSHDETITDSKLLATGYHNILTDWYTDLTTEFGTNKYGNLQVWGYNGQKYQVIIFEDGSVFTRWVSRDGTNAGTWRAIKDNRRKGKYYAFGDSRAYGLIGGTSDQSAYRYPKYIADALTMSYANYAISGSGLFERTDTGKPAALTTIQSKDISDATLITIEYGVNDWRNPIGTYEDTGDTTWCGKLYRVIQYISQTVPNATLVVIGSANTLEGTQATDYGYGYTTASGWSLGKLIDEEAKLCAKYHVPFISGYDSPLNNFVLASHMSADTIHLDDEGHRMRSEYLLGKIKTFYTLTA
jgi:lysophospholipase L1-like esterase